MTANNQSNMTTEERVAFWADKGADAQRRVVHYEAEAAKCRAQGLTYMAASAEEYARQFKGHYMAALRMLYSIRKETRK